MEFKTVIFYLFATILLGSALRVITARNPVHAVLFLVLAFFNAAGIWMLLQAEFLAIALIMVYVGAVMVLFLFVVMMLDVNIERLRQGFWSYLPLGGTIGALMLAQMLLILSSRYFGLENFPGQDAPVGASNTKDLARLMFTKYAWPFEIASLVLLVGIIGAVMLTLRKRADSKAVNPVDQIKVKRNERVRMVKMASEPDSPSVSAEPSPTTKGE